MEGQNILNDWEVVVYASFQQLISFIILSDKSFLDEDIDTGMDEDDTVQKDAEGKP